MFWMLSDKIGYKGDQYRKFTEMYFWKECCCAEYFQKYTLEKMLCQK